MLGLPLVPDPLPRPDIFFRLCMRHVERELTRERMLVVISRTSVYRVLLVGRRPLMTQSRHPVVELTFLKFVHRGPKRRTHFPRFGWFE